MTSDDADSEVHNSQYTQPTVIKFKSEDDGLDYHYIDLLAIVQVVQPKADGDEAAPKKKTRKKDEK